MTKKEKFREALELYGTGRYKYYDGASANGIGCSKYVEMTLKAAGIIKEGETFHAGSGFAGVLTDTLRFERIPWDPNNLRPLDILWSSGHHVSVWSGKSNGVYEAAPESTHGICDNGKTGVGHWSNHGYRNCGTGTNTWTCIYRIIDDQDAEKSTPIENAAETVKKTAAKIDITGHMEYLTECLPNIKYGSTGNMVKWIQTIMKSCGWYSDEIDGHAGPNTIKGIKLLQTALGMPADGCLGKETWRKLLI